MMLRRLAPVALVLGALSCQPSVPASNNPAYVDQALFDPATSSIPVPNDLVLLSVPPTLCAAPPNAQVEFICMLQAAGGFPNDQEVPIEFGFLRVPVAGGSPSPPPLDLASARWCFATPPAAPPVDCNLLMLRVDGALPAAVDPASLDLSYSSTTGALTIRNRPDAVTGSRAWPAGARYVVAVRGGASGLATTDAGAVSPMPAMYLLLQDRDLSLPENQTLIPGTPQEKMAAGQQLELLRRAYAYPVPPAPLSVFALVNTAFPYREIADLTTFAIAPSAGSQVVMDTSAGVVPLPSDFLLDPATGMVRAGILPVPGLETLDGFSTTAMIIAPTSAPVNASTVTAGSGTTTGTVSLWESTAGGWVRLHDLVEQIGSGGAVAATYVGQPVVDGSGNSPFIGLQPAVPASIPVAPFLATLPPLKGGTEHAVVITRGVQDAGGNGLVPNTVAKILLFSNPISVGGRSQLVGIDDSTAAGLEAMRLALGPVLTAAGVARSQVAMAYTFRTQTIERDSISLTAAPYAAETGGGAAIFSPISAAPFDPATVGFPLPTPDVAEFVATVVPTFDTWDEATGALAPPAATGPPWPVADALPVLVAVPLAASVATSCPPPASALKCAPLVVFHHGLGGGHLQMIALANELAKAGFVVASTDMPFHGDRAYCSQNSDCTTGGPTGPNGVCTPIPGTATQGDLVPPGTCTTGTLRLNASLTTVASANYFISANFFRTRDGIRRDLLDQSALVLALARPPLPYPQPAANPLATRLATNDGIAVDITKVYFLGGSLGAVVGTSVAAANPRFSRAVLNVGGGTAVDIMTNSPTFQPMIELLFASLIPGFTFAKVTPGDPAFDPVIAAQYLQLVSVAKWVLDPADPVNYAASVATKLPSPLAVLGPLASATTDAWGMVANGDTVIPNPFSFELLGVGAIPFTVYVSASAPGGAVPHAFLGTSVTAQDDAAAFLRDLTNPGAQVTLP